MADLKISQLTAISVLTPATDVLPVVDVGGVTKKITTNQILGSGGTATLASATITGNLTVQTNALFVNSANNRVGFGTLTPARPVDIVGSFQSSAGWALVGSPSGLGGTTRYIGGAGGTDSWYFNALTGGNHIWAFGESTAMTLNSTGLGVGVVPSFKLQIVGTSGSLVDFCGSGVAGLQTLVRLRTATGNTNGLLIQGNVTNDEMYINNFFNAALSFGTNNTERLRIDSTGNVGIGVTPAGTGGCLQLKSGITFPATQVASSDVNTLDDYEEGTFTPTIVGTSTAGTGTYTTQAGRYTKIGNRVFCEMFIAWTAHTGTGNMDITGLPFTSNASVYYSAASIGDTSGIALTASNTLGAVIVANTTTLRFRQIPVGGGNSNPVPIDTSADVILSICYTV